MALRPGVVVTVVFLTLVSIVLTIFAHVAPEFYNHNNVSLISVFPSTVPGSPKEPPIDGPTVFLGVFGMKIHCYFVYTKIIDVDHHRV